MFDDEKARDGFSWMFGAVTAIVCTDVIKDIVHIAVKGATKLFKKAK